MCYNEIMLTKTKVIVSSVSILALTLLLPNYIQTNSVLATTQNTQFQVNVRESLAVSITTPSQWATGDVNQFLRNKINVKVETNNADGFTASMTTKTSTTDLVHVADKGTIPTLTSSSTRSAFPVNRWGYSLNDTSNGSDSSTYNALVGAGGTPITIISNSESQSINNKDVYFGAKADTTKASGTYTSTVVISVVTGVIDNNNPITPVNPAQPNSNENTANYNSGTGGTTNGSTTYTYRRTSGSGSSAATTTTTEVSDGDNRNSYIGYTPPQGVTNRQTTTETVSEGSSLATGLAITSAVAATSGVIFFILAKRKKDEDEDEEEEQQ